ncbi:hypothetical protein GWI33_011517 [Rhynchophorus ferrugineus]|uniref:Uncharacterized protein n=1 Tax=Rhynchophorus ferrugineus TaxID=354439 RepID=A0A834MEQ6_RHYFE|nr:hypothetical protein GWI33_011517 [Rhynchophorus ferrugineus]
MIFNNKFEEKDTKRTADASLLPAIKSLAVARNSFTTRNVYPNSEIMWEQVRPESHHPCLIYELIFSGKLIENEREYNVIVNIIRKYH